MKRRLCANLIIVLTISAIFNADADVLGAADLEMMSIEGGQFVDHFTRLRWQRCTYGTTWMQDRCVGKIKKLTWVEARRLNPVRWSGRLWRIPNKAEMETLVDSSGPEFKIDSEIFPDVSGNNRLFWTADRSRNGTRWVVDFQLGRFDDQLDTEERRLGVRLVSTEADWLSQSLGLP